MGQLQSLKSNRVVPEQEEIRSKIGYSWYRLIKMSQKRGRTSWFLCHTFNPKPFRFLMLQGWLLIPEWWDATLVVFIFDILCSYHFNFYLKICLSFICAVPGQQKERYSYSWYCTVVRAGAPEARKLSKGQKEGEIQQAETCGRTDGYHNPLKKQFSVC